MMNKKTLVLASATALFASSIALAGQTQSTVTNPTAQAKVAPQLTDCASTCCAGSSCNATQCAGCNACSGCSSCCSADD